jgi:transposase
MERPHYPSDISPDEFDKVRPMLEGARKRTRPRKHDLYDVFCAVLYLLEQGVAWRSMPPGFPPWRTVHEYFTQWSEAPPGQPSLLERALHETGRVAAEERLRTLVAPRQASA